MTLNKVERIQFTSRPPTIVVNFPENEASSYEWHAECWHVSVCVWNISITGVGNSDATEIMFSMCKLEKK